MTTHHSSLITHHSSLITHHSLTHSLTHSRACKVIPSYPFNPRKTPFSLFCLTLAVFLLLGCPNPKTAESIIPALPLQVSPVDGATGLSPADLLLTWQTEEADPANPTVASYAISLGKEGIFPDEPQYQNISATEFILPYEDLEFDASYEWKVIATSLTGNKTSSNGSFSFSTASMIVRDNNFANGYYLWFDITINGLSSQVDFLAVKQGDTVLSKDEVTAMDDLDSRSWNGIDNMDFSGTRNRDYNALDGMHFRDTLKVGKIQRILLYNLATDTDYDVYAYFASEEYADFDGKILTTIKTASAMSALGEVDWPASVGQVAIIPMPSAIAIVLPSSLHQWRTSMANGSLFVFPQDSTISTGTVYNKDLENNIIPLLSPTPRPRLYLLKFDKIKMKDKRKYMKLDLLDTDGPDKINLIVSE